MKLGTPLSPAAIKVMLLGSGELGKEVVIELQRLGVETIAVDRYPNAPAAQVAQGQRRFNRHRGQQRPAFRGGNSHHPQPAGLDVRES